MGDIYAISQQPRPTRIFTLTPIRDFAVFTDEHWLIDDIFPQAGLGVIYGEPGCGKTFLAISAAFAIALSKRWECKDATQGRVVYICAEGEGGFKKRTHAYLKHHGLQDTDIPFDVITDVPDFLNDLDATALATSIGQASVIFVDTLSCVIAGGNENSGEDLGHAIAQCKLLHKLTGAFIVLIHHSGKDADRGARGWSGLRGAVDTEIEVKKINDTHKAKITKQKDGEFGHEWGFDLKVVELGESSTGKMMTSCVYVSTNSVPLDQKNRPQPNGRNQKKAMEIFAQNSINNYLNFEEFIKLLALEMPYEGDDKSNQRTNAKRTILTMVDKNLFDFEDNRIFKV